MNSETEHPSAAMLKGAAGLVAELLESGLSPAAAEAVSRALAGGARLGVLIDVLPKPHISVILREHEGRELVLAAIPLARLGDTSAEVLQ